MTQRGSFQLTLIAALAGAAAVAVLVFVGLEAGILPFVLIGVCVALVLVRFDVALTWSSVIVFGSIFLFQVATIPTGVKAAFIGVAGVLAIWALLSLIRRMPDLTARARSGVRLVFCAVGILSAFLLWQLIALSWNSVAIDAWMRDALNYLLLPMAVLIGVEAGFRLAPRAVSVLALLAGVIGAYSFSVAWLGRRAAEQGGDSQQFGLASSFVVFATLALCLARFTSGRLRGVAWLVAALALMGIMVVAGGRQTIVQCVIALLVAVAVGGGGFFAKTARVLTAVAAAVIGFIVVLNYSASSNDTAVGRYAFFQRFLTDGFSAITNDQSAQARLRALTWLHQQWQLKPTFGWGFGHDMINVATGQIGANVFTLDSPLVPLEKFGVFGTAVLVLALLLFFIALWKLARPETGSTAFGRTFAAIVTVLTLVTLVNGFPPENRGFPTFLLLSSLIAVSNATWRARAAADGGDSEPETARGVADQRTARATRAPASAYAASSRSATAPIPKTSVMLAEPAATAADQALASESRAETASASSPGLPSVTCPAPR
ncbi:hypothetical protein GCM10022286_30370 [Gryllotalpicola daejeonensis]|uniref:O-antigen ligase domain-containing protein n=1 Tax=Gryllotalpicola daejeonensis TaxID=993087 RepID=A0ABP7ZNJ7_9MICO